MTKLPSLDKSQKESDINRKSGSDTNLSDGNAISVHPIEAFVREKANFAQIAACLKKAGLQGKNTAAIKYSNSFRMFTTCCHMLSKC